MTDKTEFSDLLEKYIQGACTPAEKQLFIKALEQAEHRPEVEQALRDIYDGSDTGVGWSDSQRQEFVHRMVAGITNKQLVEDPSVHRVRLLYKWGWAAAVLLTIGLATYFIVRKSETKENTQAINISTDVAPGKNGAILTLADGKTIVLDSLINGTIASQGSTRVDLQDGQINYSATGETTSPVSWNTMSTPRGRQFRVVLPDGTKVWLNAASSIRYPIQFTGQDRTVEVTGEAYLEVAKDPTMPFYVKTNKGLVVRVLGTHFNVNAYDDEPTVRTTLLEGKVQVTRQNEVVALIPGQQAIAGKTIRVNKNANTESVIAWKKGLFNFDDVPFDEFMRQLARWYNLTIVYKSTVPAKIMRGSIGRDLHLSQVLKVITLLKVKYAVQGNTLTIE